jgi:hypothetical protein
MRQPDRGAENEDACKCTGSPTGRTDSPTIAQPRPLRQKWPCMCRKRAAALRNSVRHVSGPPPGRASAPNPSIMPALGACLTNARLLRPPLIGIFLRSFPLNRPPLFAENDRGNLPGRAGSMRPAVTRAPRAHRRSGAARATHASRPSLRRSLVRQAPICGTRRRRE